MSADWLATYFYEHVLLPYREFADLQDSDEAGKGKDLRAGSNVAIALYHFREQLPLSFAITLKDMLTQCSDYGIVKDIANITKHRTLTRNPPLLVRNETDAMSEIVIVTSYRDKFGVYSDFAKQVEVSLLDGSQRNLIEVLTNVLNFWIRHLRKLGLLNISQEVTLKQRVEPLDRFQCKEELPTMHLVAGLPTKFAFKFQTYNYDKQLVDVDDLTDSNVYMPLYTADNAPIVDLKLSNEEVGKEFTKAILLSPKEVETLKSLKSEEEVEDYMSGLPKVKEAFRWLSARMREEERKMQLAKLEMADE